MTRLFRLASPDDYTFVPELNLWELNFDKRPVQGVRCSDPVDGAFNYNQARMNFFSKLDTNKIKEEPKFKFNDILSWAASTGTKSQCNYVMKMFLAKNKDEYQKIALELMREKGDNYPYHLDIAIFFTGFESRLTTNHKLIQKVKDRCGNG